MTQNGGGIIPSFENAFSTLGLGKKISKDELIRAIRFFISAEYEAVQMYTQIAEATDDKVAKAVLMDIAEEEIVHAGEFLRLLKELSPDEWKKYEDGFSEVEELIKKVRG